MVSCRHPLDRPKSGQSHRRPGATRREQHRTKILFGHLLWAATPVVPNEASMIISDKQECSWMQGVPNARPQVPVATLRRSKWPRNSCDSSSGGGGYASGGGG